MKRKKNQEKNLEQEPALWTFRTRAQVIHASQYFYLVRMLDVKFIIDRGQGYERRVVYVFRASTHISEDNGWQVDVAQV